MEKQLTTTKKVQIAWKAYISENWTKYVQTDACYIAIFTITFSLRLMIFLTWAKIIFNPMKLNKETNA